MPRLVTRELLSQPLEPSRAEKWRKAITWYQIVGGKALRQKLADRRDQVQDNTRVGLYVFLTHESYCAMFDARERFA